MEDSTSFFGRTKKLGTALSGNMPSNISFEVNIFINADPPLLADMHQLFKVHNAVNAILQIITGSGHSIVNQAVRPKATLVAQAFEPRESTQLLKAPYARYPSEQIELALTTNPDWLPPLSKL